MNIKIRLSKIKTAFLRNKDSDLAGFALTVVTKLMANVYFPLTQAMLAGLIDALEAFNTALVNAKGRDKVMVEIKNRAREALTTQLLSVNASVTFEGQGDREKLLTSGYELYKEIYSPAAPLGRVKGFTLTDGKTAGEIKTSVRPVKGAKSYAHQITPAPLTADSKWYTITTTSRECLFTNLESSKQYLARVLAIGIKGQVAYSETLSRITQ
jgi:hypothetical protein